MNIIRTITILLLCHVAIVGKAQIMQENNSRTNIEAQLENRPHTVSDDPSDAKTYGHVYASHNFLFSRITRLGIEGRYEANDGDNTYYRLGPKYMHVFMLPDRKSIVLNANIYGEASQHGVEHLDGHIVGFYMYGLSLKKQEGIGLVALINNPSRIPCVPIFMYRSQLTPKSRFDFATYLASYSYDITPQLRFSAGYAIMPVRFWLKADDGARYMDSKALFTPKVVLQWKPVKPLAFGIYAGYGFTITHKLYNASGTHKVADLSKKHTPQFAARATLNL